MAKPAPPAPTPEYVAARQVEYGENAEFFAADSTIRLVVGQWPNNVSHDEVLAKLLVIDGLYSTNIYHPDAVACHIVAMHIDSGLRAGDPAIVERIATVDVGSRTKRHYSFATKYCSFHHPAAYHIYDDWVHWLLWQYQLAFAFSKFKKGEVRASYDRFAEIMADFVQHFRLTHLSNKELDKFLWIEAQHVWPLLVTSTTTAGA